MTYSEEFVEELNDRIHELEGELEDLQCDYDEVYDEKESLEDELDRAENKIEELESNRPIKDMTNFIRQCEIKGLWSTELNDFYEEYLKFFND